MGTSFQTVRLSKGKHASPQEGVCVMELASMLAGEPFSDRPTSVCPVIAAFMRAYNDRIDDDRRQDLYRYAAEVVGTRATPDVEQVREDYLIDWVGQRQLQQPLRWLPRRRTNRIDRRFDRAAAGIYAARSLRRHSDRTHEAVLALIDELIAMGRTNESAVTEAQSAAHAATELVAATA